MPNQLPLPPELRHLIEKRDGSERRAAERRSGQEQHPSDVAETPPSEPEGPASPELTDKARSGGERPEAHDRREAQ